MGSPANTFAHTSSLGSLNISSKFLSKSKEGKSGLTSPGAVEGEARLQRARAPQKVMGTWTPRRAKQCPGIPRAQLHSPAWPSADLASALASPQPREGETWDPGLKWGWSTGGRHEKPTFYRCLGVRSLYEGLRAAGET